MFTDKEKIKNVFGLDINDRSLKIIKAKLAGAKFKLVSSLRREIPDGVIEGGEIKNQSELIKVFKEAIKSVSGEPLQSKYCVCSLPEKETFVKMVQLPVTTEAEIKQAIQWEIESNIPYKIDQVYFDWQVIRKKSGHSDVLISVLARNFADTYYKVLRLAGLQALVFDIESIAIVRALFKDGSAPEPILIADLGYKHSSVQVISKEAVCFSTTIAYSGEKINQAIARKSEVSDEKGEQIKKSFGLEKGSGANQVLEAVAPIVDELADKLSQYLNFFQSRPGGCGDETVKVEKILLCGGGANLKGIANYLKEKVKIEVELANPLVNYAPPAGNLLLPEEVLTFSTALGLAIRGAKLH